MIQDLRLVFRRDLATLEREIALYPDDEGPWRPVPGCPTLGGNLVLHLAGNLRHFVGAVLGGTGYRRDRPAEFARRGASREELLREVRLALTEVDGILEGLDPRRLGEPFPLEVGGLRPPTGLFLLHLATHLAFHLGQLDYHRRAATGDPASAGPMGVAGLVP